MEKVSETNFNGWQGYQLSAKGVSCVVTPDIGGRIISLTLDGVETFFTHPELQGKLFSVEHPDRKVELGWLHYGGYKTWLAPQDNWNHKLPFFDLDSGSYSATVFDHSIHLTSPICRETGMQLKRIISISEDGVISVTQSMTNKNQHPVQWGIWDVTQMKGPGKALFPLSFNSKFSGSIKAYEDPGLSLKNMKDHFYVEENCAVLNCTQKENFKYGNDSHEGWICSLQENKNKRWLAYLKAFETSSHSEYPHECVSEVFDSGLFPYFELEVHSPIQTLKPEKTYTLKETWHLDWLPKKNDFKNVRKWISRKMNEEKRE